MNDSDVDTAPLTIRPYDLPDASLLEPSPERGRCIVFVPERIMVVIGKGSDVSHELNTETILADGIPVLRRASGGCAVVLTPAMTAISLAFYTEKQDRSTEYFCRFNELIIAALKQQRIAGLNPRGISDIALYDRKILGSSIYRNRQLVFYHAILNVAGETDLMERYLARPPRMPNYRAERSHADFVTSLAAQGYSLDIARFADSIKIAFNYLIS